MSGSHAVPSLLGLLALAAAFDAHAVDLVFQDGFENKPVAINEIESLDAGGPDWVEFRNTSAATVDLTGWKFTDSNPVDVYQFPNGTMLAPGAFLAVDLQGFSLDADDEVRLYSPQQVLVDAFRWSQHAATTYGRCPDSSGPFVETASATRGAANDCPAGFLGVIVINEIESNPEDWVEFYNRGGAPVDISGWYFTDNDPTHVYTFAPGTIIPAGGYIYRLGASVDFTFGLGAADEMNLYAPQGLIDSYSWALHAAGTYARCPDGTGAFVDLAQPTQGASNAAACPP